MGKRLIEWCFMPPLTVFQSYHGDSSHYSFLSWVSPVLGWGSEVSYPRTIPRKNLGDPVRLKPRIPGLLVKHFTTEPRRTPWEKENASYKNFPHFPPCFGFYFFFTFSQTTNSRLFQTERVCRRHFEFDENGRKFDKWVENTVGKGEIACDDQFLLFP